MSKCKKRAIVLRLIVFVGVINIIALNTFSLVSKLSYLFNGNDGLLNKEDNFTPLNLTEIQDIVLKPVNNIQCRISHSSKEICAKNYIFRFT